MYSTRYCKCHWVEGNSEHWGILDRKPFVQKGAKPHFTPDTPVVPRHLRLELHFDWEEERVWGTTTYEMEVKGRDLREIRFDAMRLEVSDVLLNGRRTPYENDKECVVVSLRDKPAPGKVLRVQITHSVTKPSAGIYFTKPDPHYPARFKTVWTQGQDEDSRFYFPCLDKPNFKQTTEAILHLPPGMFGLANGRLMRKKLTPRESLFHYKMELPYSTYLISLVAGEFVEHKETVGGVDIKWYVQKGREREGRNAFEKTGDIIRFFSGYTGYSYPYRHYTQIAVPEFIFGGMENFTVTTQTDLTLHDDRAHRDGDSNGLVAHEAAHTWFGNLVTAKNWSHAWLHESFATYFDALYTRESKGEEEFRYQMLEDAETYFKEDAQYRRPIVTNIYKEPIDLFDAHLYPGGAVRLHHLKCVVGEKSFRQALKLFLHRHAFKLVETVDFFRCQEEVTARNFDEWKEQWIYRGGYPALEVGYKWDESSSMAVVEVKQTQKAEKKEEALLFRLNMRIGFYFGKSRELFPIEISKTEEKFCFKLKAKPQFFRLDPDYECPCKKVKVEAPRPMLHEQLKRDADPIGRIEAAVALAVKPSGEDIRLLCEALRKEKFWGVAVRIASALGSIGGDQARDGLLRGLTLTHPKIRRGVVEALGKFIRDAKVAEALRRLANGDPSYRVEAAALRALGSIKDADSRQFLERAVNRPSHNDMAQASVFTALADLEDESSWALVLCGTEYGAPKNSRSAAMRSLARIARRFPHLQTQTLEQLTRLARETRGTPAAVFRGKLGAVQAMQQLEDMRAVSVLRQLAEREDDGRLCRRAEDAVQALFDSAKKPQELKEVRSELDDLNKESKSMRERLDLMEKKNETGSRAKKKRHGKKG